MSWRWASHSTRFTNGLEDCVAREGMPRMPKTTAVCSAGRASTDAMSVSPAPMPNSSSDFISGGSVIMAL